MDISLTRSGAISTHAQPPAQDDNLFGSSIIVQHLYQIELRQHVLRHLSLQVCTHRLSPEFFDRCKVYSAGPQDKLSAGILDVR